MGLEDIFGFNEILNNTNSSFLEGFPPEIISRIESLITILKITGFVVIGYILFLIIRWIFEVRKYRKIIKIYERVNEIDKKMDVLISKKKLEESDAKDRIETLKKDGWVKKLFGKRTKDKKKNKKIVKLPLN